MIKKILPLFLLLSFFIGFSSYKNSTPNENILSYEVDLTKQHLEFYWKDDNGNILKSIKNLNDHLYKNKQTLLFAMNGGMYKQDNAPQGLYIEKHKVLSPIDSNSGNGNFYLKPNGIFYITKNNKAAVCETSLFKNDSNISFATLSGPMLVVNGNIHSAFKEGSVNLNIRNGVGILPNNKIVFAMSKTPINFYDFAVYFKNLGCKDALYLDGYVSRTFLPSKNWVQLDGNFGVLIGVSKAIK